MKVIITKESRRYITLEEAAIARKIISDCREDGMSPADYAKIAIDAVGSNDYNWCVKVYEASAEICKNCRVWDAYGDDTRDLDVWIEATAKTSNGFIEIGAALSDIWSITSDNGAEIANHMYVRQFQEVQ